MTREAQTMTRKPQKIAVKVAFLDGMRHWPGYDSCSKWFHIGKSPTGHWDVIHARTGFCAHHAKTLREARLWCGIFGALPINWRDPNAWARWQAKHKYLMPWFRETHHCLRQIA
jgi:hypothetical protein